MEYDRQIGRDRHFPRMRFVTVPPTKGYPTMPEDGNGSGALTFKQFHDYMEKLDRKYAAKWVERLAWVIILAVVLAFLTMVGTHVGIPM